MELGLSPTTFEDYPLTKSPPMSESFEASMAQTALSVASIPTSKFGPRQQHQQQQQQQQHHHHHHHHQHQQQQHPDFPNANPNSSEGTGSRSFVKPRAPPSERLRKAPMHRKVGSSLLVLFQNGQEKNQNPASEEHEAEAEVFQNFNKTNLKNSIDDEGRRGDSVSKSGLIASGPLPPSPLATMSPFHGGGFGSEEKSILPAAGGAQLLGQQVPNLDIDSHSSGGEEIDGGAWAEEGEKEKQEISCEIGGQLLEHYLGVSTAAGQLRALDLSSPYSGHYCSTATLSLADPSQSVGRGGGDGAEPFGEKRRESTPVIMDHTEMELAPAVKASMMGLSGTSPEKSHHSHALRFMRLCGETNYPNLGESDGDGNGNGDIEEHYNDNHGDVYSDDDSDADDFSPQIGGGPLAAATVAVATAGGEEDKEAKDDAGHEFTSPPRSFWKAVKEHRNSEKEDKKISRTEGENSLEWPARGGFFGWKEDRKLRIRKGSTTNPSEMTSGSMNSSSLSNFVKDSDFFKTSGNMQRRRRLHDTKKGLNSKTGFPQVPKMFHFSEFSQKPPPAPMQLQQHSNSCFTSTTDGSGGTRGGELTGRRSLPKAPPPADAKAQQKHMEFLEKISSERKRAEEAKEREARRTEARQRQKRLQLIERAAARREQSLEEGGVLSEKSTHTAVLRPTYAIDTTAAKARHSLIRKPVEPPQPAALTEEDELALKDKRRAERQLLNHQHRDYLRALMAKRKEEEQAREAEIEREAFRKEAVRKLAAKKLKKVVAQCEKQEQHPRISNSTTKHPSAPPLVLAPLSSAGGGLAAVRLRRNVVLGGGGVDAGEGIPAVVEAERKRRQQLKATAAVCERAHAHLCELKKRREREEEEEEEKKKRHARRASLLKSRLAAERRESIMSAAAATTAAAASGISAASTTGAAATTATSHSTDEKGIKNENHHHLVDPHPPPSSPLRLSPERLAESISRLSRPPALSELLQSRNGGEITQADYSEWKKRMGLSPDRKVFILSGWYPSIKEGLEKRGWYHNMDRNSPYCDLRWSLYSKDASKGLQSWQMCNHFDRCSAVTTKAGLIHSLRQLHWHANVSMDDVVPRSFDLGAPVDVEEFVDEFCITAAANILKRIVLKAEGRGGLDAIQPLSLDSFSKFQGEEAYRETVEEEEEGGEDEKEEDKEEELCEISSASQKSSMAFSEKDENDKEDLTSQGSTSTYLNDSDLESDIDGGSPEYIEGELRGFSHGGLNTNSLAETLLSARRREWTPEGEDILINPCILSAALRVCCRLISAKSTGDEDLDDPNMKSQAITPLEREVVDLGSMDDFTGIYRTHSLPDEPSSLYGENLAQGKFSKAPHRHPLSKKERRAMSKRASLSKALLCLEKLGPARLTRVKAVLGGLRTTMHQYGMDGNFGQNLWIVKPAAKSRGRDISCFSDLASLCSYVGLFGKGGGRRAHWIVQKYMENPLLIANRKFDLRQWVLVTDWNPLTVWFYGEAYVRFGAEDYTTAEAELGNNFVHLVNNSIAKHCKKFSEVAMAENGMELRENMWPISHLQKFLSERAAEVEGGEGSDPWKDLIQPQMKERVVWALMCATDSVSHRKNTWELFGYDFMVDEELQPWLIEINSSPACDYSTLVTERYVRNALEDLLKVTIDRPEWERGDGRRGHHGCPDTGLWELIHKGSHQNMTFQHKAHGSDMHVRGTHLTKKKQVVAPTS